MKAYTKIFITFILVFLYTNSFTQIKEKVSLEIGQAAPTFVLRDLDGNNIFLRDYCGNLRQPWKNKIKHVVILSFFTTYCKPCLKEIPELINLKEKYKDADLKIFFVNLKEGNNDVSKYLKEKGFKIHVLLDRYSVVAKMYDVTTVPRIFIIDKEGMLAWFTKGYDKKLGKKLDLTLENIFKEN